jgi:predicted AlkP superfamily phosphohydrolase/phosphomutase
MLERMFRKKNGRFAANYGVEHDLAVDWPKTKACVVHAGIYGFLYLNLKGRQPHGSVEPEEYERLRDEIRERLLAETAQHPSGRTLQVFSEVHKTEQLYNCSRKEHEWMPDLLLVPAEGLAVVRKIRGFSSVRWYSKRRMEGTHRVDGVVVINGPNVREGLRIEADIADITPTLLAVLGLRIPIDMEGKVLQEAFSPAPTIRFEPPQQREEVSEEEVYTEEEKEALTQRLSDLGYLE